MKRWLFMCRNFKSYFSSDLKHLNNKMKNKCRSIHRGEMTKKAVKFVAKPFQIKNAKNHDTHRELFDNAKPINC